MVAISPVRTNDCPLAAAVHIGLVRVVICLVENACRSTERAPGRRWPGAGSDASQPAWNHRGIDMERRWGRRSRGGRPAAVHRPIAIEMHGSIDIYEFMCPHGTGAIR
ncbi:hypothetical protein GCM10009679_08630 [Saccharothrix algeriensis]|uniref:Uncharacterized protein n=1 Tax=Catellatospora bangladeshensis TaxID=310355 RepID=A0A8J3JSD7_9ACTN|nr:hypothetical protein Cba03nite_71570 [Catellatospora bangladeshensis]